MKSGIGKVLSGTKLFGAAMLADPYSVFRQLRENDPVHWSDPMQAWVLTRYEDVAAVLNDGRFSSQRMARARHRFPQPELQPLFDTLGARMSEKDEPDHKRMRALVHDAFTRTAVESWEPQIQQRIDSLLDAIADHGRAEFISEFAVPLPVLVILEIVGIPAEDRRQIKAWCDDFAVVALNFYAGMTEQQAKAGLSSTIAFGEYLRERVKVVSESQTSNLLSGLIQAQHEGTKLSLEELLANVLLVLSAGNETTTCLLGNALAALLQNPVQLQLLRDDPSLIPGAIEEFLRYDPPVQFLGRLATEDVQIRSSKIREGDMVLAVIGAANRDPENFLNPDQLDVTRTHVNHLSFGHGPHFCVGSQLSRLEAKLALTAIVERFPDLKLDPSSPLVYRDNFNIRCLNKLQVSV